MNHNVITVNGLEYKAVKSYGVKSCRECAFLEEDCADEPYACTAHARSDDEDVIFKRHIKLKSK
jgi:hypothetical protein